MLSVSVYACVCMYLYFCVYSVSFINLVFLAYLPNKQKSAKCEFLKKIHNFKSIIDKYTIHPL